MIPKETVENIIESSRIEEVVGDFVQLRKRGTNLVGLCPFHNEKTPSFNVNPARNIFKCFGCGKSGNSVGFIMEHEHMTFPEALRYLASKYNIEIEEKEQSPEQQQAANERESLYHVVELARKFFIRSLHQTDEGKAVGLSYFQERGLRKETIEKFGLGYSPESWDAFTSYALDQGVKREFLEKAGLSIFKENRSYDRFRARVIFPIFSLSGRAIAFGGRILDSSKSKAKYVNSPESDIYVKSDSLYGIYQAKGAIIAKDNCFLVEGYTDVTSLHQAGIENVVASSGTSLTQAQIKLIRRYTPNITILYDGDAAGIKASFRGIDMILQESMNVNIVLFPDGEDPDSFARKHRADEVLAFIEANSDNFITFKTKVLRKEAGDDPVKNAALLKDVVQSIALIPDGIARQLFVRQCAGLMDIKEDLLMQEMQKIRRAQYKKKLGPDDRQAYTDAEAAAPKQLQQQQQTINVPSSPEALEMQLLRLIILYGEEEINIKGIDEKGETFEVPVKVAPFLLNELMNEEYTFGDQGLQQIFDEMKVFFETAEIRKADYFFNHENPAIVQLAIRITDDRFSISKYWFERHRIITPTEKDNLQEAVLHTLYSLQLRMLEKMLTIKQEELKKAHEMSEEKLMVLLNEIKTMNSVKTALAGELGRIILK